MIDFRITCRDASHDTPRPIATLSHLLGEWAVYPAWCDLREARRPMEGYCYRCRSCGSATRVSRTSLHDALRRIHAHNQAAPPDQQIHDLSIQGLRTLHRTPGAGIRPPEPPPSDGGLFVPGRSEGP